MLRTMMKSKIHRATVTQADLHYVGSVTVDEDLLDAADLLPGELVHLVDVTNGARLETYTIAGERGSGVLGINGAAARLVHPGDTVILIAYGQMETAEARDVGLWLRQHYYSRRLQVSGSDPRVVDRRVYGGEAVRNDSSQILEQFRYTPALGRLQEATFLSPGRQGSFFDEGSPPKGSHNPARLFVRVRTRRG